MRVRTGDLVRARNRQGGSVVGVVLDITGLDTGGMIVAIKRWNGAPLWFAPVSVELLHSAYDDAS